jgi:hypothetical protein
MKINIENFGEGADIVITNDNMDNDNFVDIILEDTVITLSIDDLLASVLAFHTLRDIQDERNSKSRE